MENDGEVKRLIVDLAVKSYQIFLATLVVSPFVVGKYSSSLFVFGIFLTFASALIAFYFTKKLYKGGKT